MSKVTSIDVPAGLAAVRSEIRDACCRCGRDESVVTLVAVSKTHPTETIRQAIAAGQRVFGENRVPEAEEKWPALKVETPGLSLHLIGPLQRNKARRAIRLFDVIETVDRPELARFLAEVMRSENHWPKILIQVNTGEESQKAGVSPADVDALITLCRDTLALPLAGLMCIPPVDHDPAPHFTLLREIGRRHGLEHLSMGMSGDFPVAIEQGATLVRVGTAIFGHRPPISKD